MADLTLELRHEIRPRGTFQSIALRGAGVGRMLAGHSLDFSFPGQSLPHPEVLDGPMFSALMIAMRFADRLRLAGPITVQALRNATAFQEAWVQMAPRMFHPVEIAPEGLVEPAHAPQDRAILAFSGGLDGAFSAIRHARGLMGGGGYRLTHVMMVQGFDIGVDDRAGFEALVRRVRPLLAELELEPILVRTNAVYPNPAERTRMVQPYYYSQAAQIAGMFHVLWRQFGQGLIGASDPYSHMVLPWASNAATDHLLSSDRLQVVNDGAGFSRVQKAAFLVDHPTALRTLRVCHAVKPPANCGVCEKCVRTRLSFLAAGVADPPCFDQPFEEAMIEGVDPSNPEDVRLTIAYAEAAGITASWLQRLKAHLETVIAPGADKIAEARRRRSSPGPRPRPAAAAG